jgi:hypothetical protein
MEMGEMRRMGRRWERKRREVLEDHNDWEA